MNSQKHIFFYHLSKAMLSVQLFHQHSLQIIFGEGCCLCKKKSFLPIFLQASLYWNIQQKLGLLTSQVVENISFLVHVIEKYVSANLSIALKFVLL